MDDYKFDLNKDQKLFSDELKETLQARLLGDTISPDTGQQLKDVVNNSIENMVKDGKLPVQDSEMGNVQSVSTLWDLWGFKEKAKWFLTNKIFKWIARDVRVQHRNHVNSIQSLYETWEAYDDPSEGLDLYMIPLPEWAESNPKTIVKLDVVLKVAQPLEFISINISGDQLHESTDNSE